MKMCRFRSWLRAHGFALYIALQLSLFAAGAAGIFGDSHFGKPDPCEAENNALCAHHGADFSGEVVPAPQDGDLIGRGG